jgi:vesicle-fusing ATPase
VAVQRLQSSIGDKLSIGIKKLMMVTEMARQDEAKLEKFISAMTEDHTIQALKA